MKKQLVVLAAILAAVGLAACSPKAEEGTKEPISMEETVEDTTEDTTGEASGETDQVTDGESGDQAGESGDQAGESAGESIGESEGSSQEVGGPAVEDPALTEIRDALKKAYGDQYIPSMLYYDTELEEMFGVKKDWYDAYIAEGPMISAHVETFIGVKAKPGKAADVKAALESFRKNQIENSMQYPMNMPKLEASQVIVNGDYVFFVMLGGASQDAEEQGEEAALQSAKENNQIGVDVINDYFSKNK